MGFARKLPVQVAVLAPRGLYIAPVGGFTWCEIRPGKPGLPAMDDFRLPAEVLIGLVEDCSHETGVNVKQIDLIGFSQGAAFSYTLALLYPDRIRALAALSGIMPKGAEDLLAKRLPAGKPVFIAHGRQDKMIPVEEARRSVELLEASGARVMYCESDGGHKVNAECFSGLADLFG